MPGRGGGNGGRKKQGRTAGGFCLAAGTHHPVHCWQGRANGSDDWSNWDSLDADILPGFAVNRNAAGRLELFGVSATNADIIRIVQSRVSDSRAGHPGKISAGTSKTAWLLPAPLTADSSLRGERRRLADDASLGEIC